MGELVSLKNAFGIYHVIEQRLRHADHPLTCVDLFDFPDVKQYADDANRVSDYLGHMYRRGLLKRFAAPKEPGVMARYAYSWKDPKLGSPVQRNVQPRLTVARARHEPTEAKSNGDDRDKPKIQVTEEEGGGITLDLPQFTLTIRIK